MKPVKQEGPKKKTVAPMENDYRDERDQRTIFVKNLPFSASVDDVSFVVFCQSLIFASCGKFLQPKMRKIWLTADLLLTSQLEITRA